MTAQPFSSVAGDPDDAKVPLLGARFRLEDQVGTDQDAAVWRASDERLHRAVTIYVLCPRSVTSELTSAVQAVAGISDPRVARIFDVAYGGERPYVVSEWVPGKNIEELLAVGCPDPFLATNIVADAAEALAIAHGTGVAHLCMGPRSLRWDRGSGVKISGLGIEAALRHAQAVDPAAADTCALGRMLYALLTGYWPGSEPTSLPPAPRRDGRWCPPRKIRPLPRGLSTITVSTLPDEKRHVEITEPAELARALRRTVQSRPIPPARRLGGWRRDTQSPSKKHLVRDGSR